MFLDGRRVMAMLSIGTLMLGCAAMAPAIAQTKTLPPGLSNTSGAFMGSNQTASVDCKGEAAKIAGSGNTLTITGNCESLQVAGSNNRITVALAAGGTVELVGSNNDIIWTTADGKEPMAENLGSNNKLTKASR